MKKENIGTLQMLLCAALWSSGGILMKLIPWNGFAIAGMRSLISGLTFVVYMLLMRYRFAINRRTLLAGLFTGLTYVCFVCANKLTTAANAIVLQFTSPVFIVIFSAILYHKRPKKSDALVVLFTLLGIALFFFDQLQPGYILGNFVAIAAGMFMSGMFMTIGDLPDEERFSAVFLGHMITFLIGLPMILTTDPLINRTTVICILALGVFQLGISYILYVHANKYCPPLACALLGAVEPLLNPVWVLLFDGETPGLFAICGAVVVIVSITTWLIYGNKEKAAEPQPE